MDNLAKKVNELKRMEDIQVFISVCYIVDVRYPLRGVPLYNYWLLVVNCNSICMTSSVPFPCSATYYRSSHATSAHTVINYDVSTLIALSYHCWTKWYEPTKSIHVLTFMCPVSTDTHCNFQDNLHHNALWTQMNLLGPDGIGCGIPCAIPWGFELVGVPPTACLEVGVIAYELLYITFSQM